MLDEPFAGLHKPLAASLLAEASRLLSRGDYNPLESPLRRRAGDEAQRQVSSGHLCGLAPAWHSHGRAIRGVAEQPTQSCLYPPAATEPCSIPTTVRRLQHDPSSLCSTVADIPPSRPAYPNSTARKRCPGCRRAAPARRASAKLPGQHEHGAILGPVEEVRVSSSTSRGLPSLRIRP
jgi:hypothetical protein